MFDPYIKTRAQHRPHAVAISSLRGDITYGQFDLDIDAVAGAIQAQGLGDTRLAAVSVANAYAHWLILLALCRLRIASASVGGLGPAKTIPLLNADLLITDGMEEAQAVPVLRVTPEWLVAALKQRVSPRYPLSFDPNGLARVTLSSGTTGEPKQIGMSWDQCWRRVVDASFSELSKRNPASPVGRHLYMLGLDTVFFYSALASLHTGSTLVLFDNSMLSDVISLIRLSPNVIYGSPRQVQVMMEGLGSKIEALPHLTMILAGSHLPAALGRTLRLRLTTDVWNGYGSTEVGWVAMGALSQLDGVDGAVGWLQPATNVEIVDENDEALPPNQVGVVRIKTSSMTSGYLNDEETSARHFRAGWFYPGDMGLLSEDGLLRIVGRSGEVMNVGGAKFLPRVLEDAVLSCKGVIDAAAFLITDSEHMATPWIAIVRGEGFDESKVSEALGGLGLPPIHLGWATAIPRNERGKVQTDRLVAAAQGRSSHA